MNKTKQLTTKQRILFYLGLVAISTLVGGITGVLGLGFDGKILKFNFDSLVFLVRGLAIISVLLNLWFIYQANHYYNRNEQLDDNLDEEVSYDTYRKTFKNLEFANIFYNISSALVLFLLLGCLLKFHDAIVSEGHMFWKIQIVDIALFILMVVLQIIIFKLNQKIRRYKISTFPTIAEVKEFLYSYDEGELQANYEQSFLIVFNLNYRIIPAIYVILYLLAFFTSLNVVSGIIVVVALHIYINLANIRFVNKYFRK
ncbi:Protein of unknown function [Streptococcus equinus]|uniref:DUF3169 family protein n=2 Tax=Streptococcus equinus TaxID=1335 RepID=A0A1H0M037_STREI|nr:Protein of unknown function [Streptococcus equinus]